MNEEEVESKKEQDAVPALNIFSVEVNDVFWFLKNFQQNAKESAKLYFCFPRVGGIKERVMETKFDRKMYCCHQYSIQYSKYRLGVNKNHSIIVATAYDGNSTHSTQNTKFRFYFYHQIFCYSLEFDSSILSSF